MSYNTDLVQLPQLAAQHEQAFEVMMYQLQYDDDLTDEHLDALVTQIAAPILEAIDCKTCGNCCRSLEVYLEEADIPRLAQGIHVSIADIETRYISRDMLPDADVDRKFAHRPCTFLNGTLCGIYEHRPQACRDYPFLTPDFRWSLEQLIGGASICPIIYHTLVAVEAVTDEITGGRL
jgi:hypothetical protein